MVSELKRPHFYKPNVLAMLNTLFPPSVKELPNDKIDKSVLHKHRAHLYRCILEREKHGPRGTRSFRRISYEARNEAQLARNTIQPRAILRAS